MRVQCRIYHKFISEERVNRKTAGRTYLFLRVHPSVFHQGKKIIYIPVYIKLSPLFAIFGNLLSRQFEATLY